MEWTVRIEELLDDGEEHLVSDVVAAGAAVVPEERALEEMGGRASHSDNEARASAGAKTLAKQSLMAMVRFGKVSISKDKKIVQKTLTDSTSLGAQAARLADVIARLERVEAHLGIGAEDGLTAEQVETALNGTEGSVRDGVEATL